MPDKASITDLCSICYENKPKYRCPRCQTKTCSLPCTQKHKQRASCNGIRNPAEYVKRSQLATPVGIDRDYNYLKSVERSIDVANRDSEARGVDVVERAAMRSLARARHPESILRKYLVQNRIEMRQAPEGMSRRKANQTRSTKRHQIMWTVEWVDVNEQKQISESCLASSSIAELYALKRLENSNAAKRKPGEHPRIAQKRRRKDRLAEAQERADTEEGAAMSATTDPEATTDQHPGQIEESAALQIAEGATVNETSITQASVNDNTTDLSNDSEETIHFYLLRPGTNAKAKVLIPLDGKASLTNCLQDRTVMEFPTIHVLPHEPQSLPSEYMLAEQYLQLRKREDEDLQHAMAQAERKGVLQQVSRAEASAPAMDANSILNVLKRDLTR